MLFKVVRPTDKYKDNEIYKDIVNYCLNPQKTPHNLIIGYNLDVDDIANDMFELASRFDKFQMAVDDDLIRKNTFSFQPATVIVNDSVTREALTRKQERAFLDFVATDKHFQKYYDGIYILFKTGMRISEFVGLTLSDIDLKNRRIHINHQLQRTRNMQYIVEDTKTTSGTRVIPMTDDVYNCFQRIIRNRRKPSEEPIIDGYSGFLFLDKDEKPVVALHWEHYFKHIRQKYNSIYKVQMPKVTPPCVPSHLLLQHGKKWHES